METDWFIGNLRLINCNAGISKVCLFYLAAVSIQAMAPKLVLIVVEVVLMLMGLKLLIAYKCAQAIHISCIIRQSISLE